MQRIRKVMEQCLKRANSKGYNINLEALTTLILSHWIVPRVERLKHNLSCHISGAENVASDAQRASRQLIKGMSRQQECHVDTRARLSLFVETSVSSRLGGLCTVPSPGVDQSQIQSQKST